jgi:hypothetical protein
LIEILLTLALLTAPDEVFAASGTWTVETGAGLATLVLEVDDQGSVSGSFRQGQLSCTVAGALLVDEDDESSVEGTWDCGAGGAEFEFYLDAESGYEILVIPVDASGVPHTQLAGFWPARRTQDTAPDAAAPGLVGVWSTQVIMNSPEGSVATQLFMEIRADGTIHDLGARSLGGGPDWSGDTGLLGAGESARWRTEGDVLQISYQESPWVPLARYHLEDTRLGLSWYDGTHSVWHRQ